MYSAAIITGIGLVTPLGIGVEPTWRSLLAGESIRGHGRVVQLEKSDEQPTRVFQLARRASIEALIRSPRPDALVVGTSKGEIDNWLADPGAALPLAGIGNLAAQLGAEFGIIGPRLTISAACASGLQALIRGAMLIAAGDADRVLVVAAESSLHPMFLANYRRLGVLAPEGERCRPFDANRSGFCLSEAAAAIVLESSGVVDGGGTCKGGEALSDHVLRSSGQQPSPALPANKNRHLPPAGAEKKIAIDSFAQGGDATHLTGSDPTGKPLQNLLARVVAGRRFDLIHAHGTGTIANDQIELQALESVLADQTEPQPAAYSHKGALGHSLGAAGLVSVVLDVQMHRIGIIPGNVNTLKPMPTRSVTIRQQPEHRKIRRSLAIAAGFGGAIAAVSLEMIE